MNENYRHQQLIHLVNDRKRISTAELIAELNISPATARRDINKLNEQGRLKKVRNGAEAINADLPSFSQRQLSNVNNLDEKRRIAEAAAKLCNDGESVVLTCGSTMLILGDALCGRDLQIITNYLPLANSLIENEHSNVVIMGGQYTKSQAITLSLGSELEYAAHTLFTSGKGLTTEGLYKNDMLIANSEQRMADKVERLIVLLDSTKLGKRVGMLFSELKNIDVLITGREADPEIINQLRMSGLKIILA